MSNSEPNTLNTAREITIEEHCSFPLKPQHTTMAFSNHRQYCLSIC